MHLQTRHGYELFSCPEGFLIQNNGSTAFVSEREAMPLHFLLASKPAEEQLEAVLEDFLLSEEDATDLDEALQELFSLPPSEDEE